MIAPKQKNRVTFGEFVAAAYRAKGKNNAPGFVSLALNAHLIRFQQRPFSVSMRSAK
ncbi:MAG: hypothetical protein ACXWKH_10095 [Limisphaerales bacterium]